MGLPAGSLERSLSALTVGFEQSRQFRERKRRDGAQGEHLQVPRIQLAGIANLDWAFEDKTVIFDWPFLYAPTQRLVPFKTPHFMGAHFELIGTPLTVIMLTAQVVGWTENEEGWFTGATIRINASAPSATGPTPFSAIAHLTFQGYAAYAEGDEFAQ